MAVETVPKLHQIRRAIPDACFKPQMWRSVAYVIRDYGIVGCLFYFAWCLSVSDSIFVPLGWFAYWFLQGTFFWAIFVLGHDCGHGSFSANGTVNSWFGNILHTSILVPYWPWALSHRHHHQNTGHIDNDEPFAPQRSSRNPKKLPRSHWKAKWSRGLVLLGGTMWMPYLMWYSKCLSSHFNPNDPMFEGRKTSVQISLACYAAFVAFLFVLGLSIGFYSLLIYYGVPLFVFWTWLIVTTFLHHNAADVPWYGDGVWNYVRGNLSSIDRSYGVFDHWVHDIGTHQVHHLLPFIPHYRLREATKHFKNAYPELSCRRDENILASFFRGGLRFARHGHVQPGVQVFRYPSD